jgi:hypothetical protein
MKRYLLTVIGNFDSKKICKEIAIGVTPIVDSPHLKFQHAKGILIFHFESEVDKVEIYDYILGLTYGITDTFILTEINDNVSVCLPEEVKGHLFDLENSNDDISMNIDMSATKNGSELNFDEEEDEDFIALLLGQKDNLLAKPTLNHILDKIGSSGYESLSQYEKDILEEYSKN